MPNEFSDIKVEKRDQIALITLNRPAKLNPMRVQTLSELKQALQQCNDDDDTRCVVLTGSGRAFCVGADAQELASLGPEVWLGRNPPPRLYEDVFRAIRELDKAVIAAINGWCVGGGYTLAMTCDILIASDDAMFYYPETAYGYPSPVSTSLMLWYTTPSWVKEILFCGRRVDAQTAMRIGLVNRVVPRSQLLDQAMAMAKEIAERPPRAIRMQKELVNRIWMHGWESVIFAGIHTSVAAHADFSWQQRMRDFKQTVKPGDPPAVGSGS